MTHQPIYGVIPARYGSSRFPGKPLADILGKPMFWHVYQRAAQCALLDQLVLATDDARIQNAAQALDVPVVLTRADHASGTDRVLEAARALRAEPESVVVNIQGDEPALDPAMLDELLAPFTNPAVRAATLATPLDPEEAACPDRVKVALAKDGRALYFSRAPIPYDREGTGANFLLHLGLYAFRMEALECFAALPPSPLEQREQLEQLRFLENGIPMYVNVTSRRCHGVDRPEDLAAITGIILREHTP